MDKIKISGAKCHNLKNISLEIPKNRLVIITGLSGSGKSSLAFDTIYAEGQRRYVESLSAYARQFLELMEKPDVDYIEGLSPSISIQQHSPSKNPRSTVGTVTEIYDYMRLLFARAGEPFCHLCGRPVRSWSIDGMAADIMKKFSGKKIRVLAPVIRGRIGTYEEIFSKFRKGGYARAEIDSKLFSLDKPPRLDKYVKHSISIIIDEFTLLPEETERLKDDMELAIKETGDLAEVQGEKKERVFYSQKSSCPFCNVSLPEPEPRLFSFNSPFGACAECSGLGVKIEIDMSLAINPALALAEGALIPWSNPVTTRTNRWKNSWSNYYMDMLAELAKKRGIPMDKPFSRLREEHKKTVLYGDEEFEGVISNLRRRYAESESDFVREEIYSRYMHETLCPKCGGKRLKPEALSVLVSGKNIHELTALTVQELKLFFEKIDLNETRREISRLILKEINSRLSFLLNVGLGYLSLSRASQTLSGGEAQRIQLATQIGSGLTGVLYVLDEPTIGLHQADNIKLIKTLKTLRDSGNTLIVVEHDENVIKNSDHIVDMGPGAGVNGGRVIAQGPLKEIIKNPASLTGLYLAGKKKVAEKETFRKAGAKSLEFLGARQFNLKDIDVRLPLGLFNVICGVSGSGKSTLLYEIIYKALAKQLYGSKEEPGEFRKMKGAEHIDKVIIVDQSPIGKTPRSNPATYTGVFDHIRELFSMMPEAKRRGYDRGRFSFNLKGGRCENCQGDGTIKIEMQFLPDVYVKCDECAGKRFNKDTLEVLYKGKNISEVLGMSVDEALSFFKEIPQIEKKLSLLEEVGLGYVKLGQSSTTLSGGEAQRIKLSEQLAKRATGKTLYILDEPTTGLHFADVEKLLKVMNKLVDAGNTIIVIEHNLDVIKSADWIIELGPEGGPGGGRVIYSGPAGEIAKSKESLTKDYLK
ncbi:MAG: excinuclease ABC subunit UvrA [Elusimicrobia bacterium CG08_land_8_20_14_0_20_51_18]|nr:MAG: excinuclease ABC subunit UvrA [Elusimicrobia bacterium CG08_land_8_20_14_0_20_51_18]